MTPFFRAAAFASCLLAVVVASNAAPDKPVADKSAADKSEEKSAGEKGADKPSEKSLVKLDPKLSPYKLASGISGSLKCVGSDTMNNLVSIWGDGFHRYYPNVRIEAEGKGSSTAPTALTEGSADFGSMSRDMKKAEIDEFEKKWGYKPTQLPVAIDMLAVFVHKSNPIESLTLEQLDAIYSVNRKAGGKNDIRTWGDLGLKGEWESRPISLYGRNAASGTYGYFKEAVLLGGDFKSSVKEQPGSSAVIQGVGADVEGLGYSGIGYRTPSVRAVPLSRGAKSKPVPAEADHAYTGDYPLSRFLQISVNYKPSSSLPPLKAEFLRYVYSAEGQHDVIQEGFFPLVSKLAEKQLVKVGLRK